LFESSLFSSFFLFLFLFLSEFFADSNQC
jgi:hypothetical protein